MTKSSQKHETLPPTLARSADEGRCPARAGPNLSSLDPRGMCVALGIALAAAGCQPRIPAQVSQTTNSDNATTSTANTTTVPSVPDSEGPPAPESEPDSDRKRDQLVLITFDDLELKMAKDSVFDRSLLTDRVKELDGRRVRIRGFIYPSIMQQSGITKFPLVKNTQCKFGPGGIAHHLIVVEMQEGSSTSFTVRAVAVEGRLSLSPFEGPDGNTWAIYHMVGEKVE